MSVCLCVCAWVHLVCSIQQVKQFVLWCYSGWVDWDMPVPHWTRQEGPVSFLKHCFGVFYWCPFDDSPWHLLLLCVLSKSLAIVKLLVRDPLGKYLRCPAPSLSKVIPVYQSSSTSWIVAFGGWACVVLISVRISLLLRGLLRYEIYIGPHRPPDLERNGLFTERWGWSHEF